MREKGEMYITFTPKTNRFELEKFFTDPQKVASITRELKSKMDAELQKKGIKIKKSRMEPDFQKFGLKYYAEYDPPKRYGVAIGAAIQAAVKAVVKAIIQAVKAIIKLVVKAIKAIVKFIQKLMIYIRNLIHFLDQALGKLKTAEWTQEGSLDPNNPDDGLNSMEKEADKELSGGTSSTGISSNIFSSSNSWVILGGIGALALVLAITLRK
jgi:hypothetical protein